MQAAHEVEVALAILHAVVPLRVLAEQLEVVHCDRMVVEHLLDDLRHLHVLEDAAVGGARQEPQPRPDDRLVAEEPAARAGQRKARDEAVHVPLGVVAQLDLDRHRLAEDLVDLEVVARAEQRHRGLGQRAERLAAAERLEQQIARLEGGGLDAKALRHAGSWTRRVRLTLVSAGQTGKRPKSCPPGPSRRRRKTRPPRRRARRAGSTRRRTAASGTRG